MNLDCVADEVWGQLLREAKTQQRRNSLQNIKDVLAYLIEKKIVITIAAVGYELNRLGKSPTEASIRNDKNGFALYVKSVAAQQAPLSMKSCKLNTDISAMDRITLEAKYRIQSAELKRYRSDCDRKSEFIRKVAISRGEIEEQKAQTPFAGKYPVYQGDEVRYGVSLLAFLRELYSLGFSFSSAGIQSEHGRYLGFADTIQAFASIAGSTDINQFLERIHTRENAT